MDPPGQPWSRWSSRRFWGFPPFSALVETIALAVHFQDMDMVGETVQQGPGQAFGAEHLRPLIEGQIAGHQGGAALVALAEYLEQQFGSRFAERHEAKFVDDLANCLWKRSRRFSSLASINSWTNAAAVIKPTVRPFWQAARPRPRATWVFPVPCCRAR